LADSTSTNLQQNNPRPLTDSPRTSYSGTSIRKHSCDPIERNTPTKSRLPQFSSPGVQYRRAQNGR
jgi:hypothetical protein